MSTSNSNVTGKPKVVPLVPMVTEHYWKLPGHTRHGEKQPGGQEARLEQAEMHVRDRGMRLAKDFARSVKKFDGFHCEEAAFYAKSTSERDKLKSALTGTARFVIKDLKPRRTIAPKGKSRFRATVEGVVTVPSAKLAVEYVDREIVAARAPGQRFPDGSSTRFGVRADLLLVAKDQRMPVVGEIKIGTKARASTASKKARGVTNDKDPYWGLIQALAGAAHVVSEHQQERLRTVYPEAKFREGGRPQVDLYLVLVDYPEGGTYLQQLLARSAELSQLLLTHDQVSEHVRRIVCLNLRPDDSATDTLFAYERQ